MSRSSTREPHTPTGAFKVRGGARLCRPLESANGRHGRHYFSNPRQSRAEALPYAAGRYGPCRSRSTCPRGNSIEEETARMAGVLAQNLVEHGEGFPGRARGGGAPTPNVTDSSFVPSFHPDLVMGVATLRARTPAHRRRNLDILYYVPIGQGSGICGCNPGRATLLGLKTEIVVACSRRRRRPTRLSFASGALL